MYAAIIGTPSGVAGDVMFEDCGIEEKALEQATVASNNAFRKFIGSNWISQNDAPGPSTRVPLAVRDDEGDKLWKWVVLELGEQGLEAWNEPQLLIVCKEYGLYRERGLLLPILQTKRIVTNRGVVFAGRG